jgi:hypothetical protein
MAPEDLDLLLGTVLALFAAVLLAPLLLLMWKGPRLQQASRERHPLPEVPEEPDELRRALRDLAAWAEQERGQLMTTNRFPGIPFGSLATRHLEGWRRAVESLEPDQQAALTAAAVLGTRNQESSPERTLHILVALLLSLAGAGLTPWLFPSGVDGFPVFPAALVVPAFITALLCLEGNLSLARLRRQQEEADLKVARAMDHPECFLEMLRQMEALERQLAAEDRRVRGLSPYRGYGRISSYGERRRRLKRRLGLD